MEYTKCIFCKNEKKYDNNSDTIAVSENGYYGMRCSICGLIYLSPRPRHIFLQKNYESNEKKNAGCSGEISEIVRRSISLSKRIEARYNLRKINKYIRNGTLLEIGPGPGFFLEQALKKGYSVYGLEVNPSRANYIKNILNIKCINTSIENWDSNNKFDIIYHSDVISHL